VSFVDPDTGTAVGVRDPLIPGGVILHTTDGGQTWTYQVSPENLRGVAFADWQTGLAVGERGLILRSADGGATWQRVSSGTTLD